MLRLITKTSFRPFSSRHRPAADELFHERSSIRNDFTRDRPLRTRTPGFIAPHLWRLVREEDSRVKSRVFQGHIHSSLPANFLAIDASVKLLGKPVRENQLNYNVYEKFSSADLDTKLAANIATLGLDSLSHVQKHAIGILQVNENDVEENQEIIGKYDLMAAAQTGSGKTLAFLVPILDRIMRFYPAQAMESLKKEDFQTQFPLALILAPTRELVQQINQVINKLTYRTYIRGVGIYGGERPTKQAYELAKGCHITAATPGRLLDFLQQGLVSLQHCHSLVLDEADRMLDMGFEPQLRKILETPQFHCPKESRQTALFSATFPHEVAYLAREMLRGDQCVSMTIAYHNADGSKPTSMVLVPEWGSSVPKARPDDPDSFLSRVPTEIRQSVRILPKKVSQDYESSARRQSGRKWHDIVCELIDEIRADEKEADNEGEVKRILVFCNTKSEVDHLDDSLYKSGYKSAALHGDKAQSHRDKAVDYFRQGQIEVLIATSVAARGLDFPRVAGVINAGVPINLDDYVHRIGRTGRLGHPGIAVTVYDPTSATSPDLAYGIAKLIHARNPDAQLPEQFERLANSSSSSSYSQARSSQYQKKSSSHSFRHRFDRNYGSQRLSDIERRYNNRRD